ncbi:MAG: phosphatase PAP2 family protein, partial [Actinomycetota bacterium]|nr:phosphatase PAP2 family protein [Actinomycetota bacterium]
MTTGTLEPSPAARRPRSALRWWREVLYGLAFYGVYTLIRNINGSKPVSRIRAYTNALRMIRLERFFHLFQEQRIQSWFLHSSLVVAFLDDFYGTAHFVVTVVVLVFVYRRAPERYRLWRNALAITTALALLGFAFFPLMPPRLLPSNFHIVDTLETVGGLWSFESGPMSAVSNQYAAMPSLHFAWSLWCALALAPAVKPTWGKVLAYCYPALTLVCIVATGNHFFVDAVAGAAVLGIGYTVSRVLVRVVDARR